MEMSEAQARKLVQLNTCFYAANAESFSATRQAPWAGWRMLLDESGIAEKNPRQLSVLDIACGNMRYKDFIDEILPDCRLSYYAVDNCRPLAGDASGAHFVELDVMGVLFDDSDACGFGFPLCDLSVSFGFMHHVPTAQMRTRLMQLMSNQTKPGGIIAVSLWRFDRHEKSKEKALLTTAEAQDAIGPFDLGEDDYLLGWQNKPGQYRYCHSFSDAEVDFLKNCTSASLKLMECFDADGKTGDMNTYLVFRRV